MEWYVVGEQRGGHDHTRHPEEENVVAGLHHVGGVEAGQVGRLLRPAQRGEGPQGAAEPRIQHVRVLGQRQAAAGFASSGVNRGHGLVAAAGARPDRDAVAPPQLAADAPGADIDQPVVPRLHKVVGHDGDAAAMHGGQGHVGHRARVDEPLLADHRLDDLPAALAAGDVERVRLGLDRQPGGLHVGPQALAANEAIQPGIGAGGGVHRRVGVHDRDDGQPLAAADLEVVGVVAGRHLQRAGAEGHLHVLVGDDGNFAVEDGHEGHAADVLGVAFVVGMDGHGRVAQDRLRPRRGHGQEAAAGDGVLEVVEFALFFDVFDLQIGHGRL